MTETRYSCDRCKARIDSNRARLILESGPVPPSWPRDPAIGRSTLDFCESCFEALASFVAAGSEREPFHP
jgi:hypothetical protein